MFQLKMIAAELPFIVTCVDRPLIIQMALYTQGRLSLKDVNKYREVAGMDEIPDGDNKVVTWTLKSDHIPEEEGGQVPVFDIALKAHTRVHWNTKINVNDNEIPDYKEAGLIARTCGLDSGVFWDPPDPCHIFMRINKPVEHSGEAPA